VSLRFADYHFSEPVALDGWTPPYAPGLFAILALDPSWTPLPYRLVFIGEAAILAEPRQLVGHPRTACWVEVCGTIYVAVVLTSGWSVAARRAAAEQISAQYHPVCQAGSAAERALDGS
jgi:hypothetical protein